MKLPFGVLPGHWGLAGKTREVAKAEYELVGYDLEKKLIQIRADEYTQRELATKLIDLEYKHGRISKFDHLRSLAGLVEDEMTKDLALLEIDLKEGLITNLEYQKKSATIKNEPWVTVLNMDFGGKQSLEGSFELDWNEAFVENLEKEGYKGGTPDQIVNMWFMEVCRNVAMEEFDGQGDFTADSAANLDALKRWNANTTPIGKDHRGYS